MAETSTAAERSMDTDIISTLPNPLLCHILSFLPTIDAVGTSVLSRRWRHLWKDLQVFDFHDERIRDREGFVSFVESVLSRRSYPDIQKFSLRCYSLDDLNALKRWIRDVLGPCLQEMELNFYDYKTRNGIDAIFTCATLVSLSLVGHFYMNDIPAVHLPLLKNLELAAPGVPVDSKLISGCPALEDLYFIYSGRFNPKINLLSASLKRLRLIEARNFDYSEISEIQIDAPNLEFLRIYLEDSCVRTLAVSDFPNMNEASFDIYPKHEHVDWLPKLLQALSKTKKLGLGGFSTQGQHSDFEPLRYSVLPEPSSWTQPASVPSCVMSHLNILEFRRYPDSSEEREFFAYILQNALVLKTITIYTNIGSYEEEKEHILNEISALPRGSSLCQVEEFSYCKWG